MTRQNTVKIVSIVAVAIVIAIIAVLVWQAHRPRTEMTAPTPTATTQPATADLGVCKLLSKAAIAKTLGNQSSPVADPRDSGITTDHGDQSQTCTYPLGHDRTASLVVGLQTYKDDAHKTRYYPPVYGESIDGLGQKSNYSGTPDSTTDQQTKVTPDGQKMPVASYRLTVDDGLKIYTFRLDAPHGDYTNDQAKADLSSLAKQALQP